MASREAGAALKCLHGTSTDACLLQVRKWDAQTLVNTDIHNGNKAVFCLAASAASPSVVAFGGTEWAWRLWDSRQSKREDMVGVLQQIGDRLFNRRCRDHGCEMRFVPATAACRQDRCHTLPLISQCSSPAECCNHAVCTHNRAVMQQHGFKAWPCIWRQCERALCERYWGLQGLKPFSSHANWITSVAWSPHSEHQVLTTSNDKTAKLWDTRAAVPLHTLEGHADQVTTLP